MSNLISKLKELDKQATPAPLALEIKSSTVTEGGSVKVRSKQWYILNKDSTEPWIFESDKATAEKIVLLYNALPQLSAALEVVEKARVSLRHSELCSLTKPCDCGTNETLAALSAFDALSLDKDEK